ncbi:MAG: radical SAM family heme chaperone HemW [Gemmatimonadota bacterium]|nr:radical SAM family heme chaperone HemW [Gemmatimonadota bacterium]MDH3569046.1 radical SAM family heme chaperone HemW [Gemmatimonadota bacterium]MDH5548637.1 radical SAM family heme chaperone HemW [Gemmatimonadota bacterium]
MPHLYVHVPFCRRRCVYCDFSIAVRPRVPAERFVAAIRREADLRRGEQFWAAHPLRTLYLGGGTPSLLPSSSVATLVQLVRTMARDDDPATVEVTLEANPEDVTPASAGAWAAAGVNRVSLGVQSFDGRVLQWMHRSHDAEAAPRAVRTLRRAGIDAISLDLIFGLPETVQRDFRIDLERAVDLGPDHLSVYGLTVEPRTALGHWTARGTVMAAPDTQHETEFLLAHEVLGAAGFEHYEVSNFARSGHRSHHNAAYWNGSSYLGLGPSAHSFRDGVRSWNVAPWAAYATCLENGDDPEDGRERLTPVQQRLERAYLGLRTTDGVDTADVPGWRSAAGDAAVEAGWLVVDRSLGRIRTTPVGWLRLDSLVEALTTEPQGG